jgi:hypothetical protein
MHRSVLVAIAWWTPFIFAATPSITQQSAELPLAFKRQGDTLQARYVAHGNGYAIGLHDGNATIGVQPEPGGSAGAITMAGGGKPDISGHFFGNPRKNGTKQLSLDFGAAALNAKAIAADRTVDPTAVSRRSAPAPRESRDTGRHTS